MTGHVNLMIRGRQIFFFLNKKRLIRSRQAVSSVYAQRTDGYESVSDHLLNINLSVLFIGDIGH